MTAPLTDEEWARQREENRQDLPEALADSKTLPEVLLPYQQQLLATTATEAFVVCEKSRRIGMTWAVGADAVLSAAAARGQGGMDVLYIGFNLDMAREFIDVCAMWARAFVPMASAVGETVFTDIDEHGDTKEIKAFRISFASGYEIMALTSKPRSLRGRQGYVIFDEAAFHDELDEMLKAAMALLMWGGKVLVISTHDGVDNPFNELCEDVRRGPDAGGRAGKVVRVDFDQAVDDGLYERIALVNGLDDADTAKAAWIAATFAYYKDAADEELRCIPRAGSGAYLTRASIEACMTEALPVARLICPDGFELRPIDERRDFVQAWLDEHVIPYLGANHLDPNRRAVIGEDFGRTMDLTVIAVGQERQDLSIETAIIVELKNCPIAQQKQVLKAIHAKIPRFGGAHFDATGNGLGLAEGFQEEWGHELVEAVKISQGWYLETMPKLRGHIQDGTILLPQDADILDDLRALKLVRGIPTIPDKRKGGRHGDAAIALAMMVAAMKSEVEAFGYTPLPGAGSRLNPVKDHNHFDEDAPESGRFGNDRGAW